ncbi:MAG: hypothetical protein Q9167_006174 [Letrouitia subvulpina]
MKGFSGLQLLVSEQLQIQKGDLVTPAPSTSLAVSNTSYSHTSSSSSGASLQAFSRRLKQAVTGPNSVDLKVRDSLGRFAKPSPSLAKTEYPESTSAPERCFSMYANDIDDVFTYKDRVHFCNDRIAEHERRTQEINEEILSLVKVKTQKEDTFRLIMTKMLEPNSREAKVKSESSEPDNGHVLTAPKLLQQIEQSHIEDRSSHSPLETYEIEDYTKADPNCGNRAWKEKRKHTLDAGETSKDDQMVNPEKKRKRRVIESDSTLISDDVTSLNKYSEEEKKKKRKNKVSGFNAILADPKDDFGPRNSTEAGEVSNKGSPRTSKKANINIKKDEKVVKDQDYLRIENGQRDHKKIKPTSKPERCEKQSSKGKDRIIEDGEQVHKNGPSRSPYIWTPMAIEPEQVSNSNGESKDSSQPGSVKNSNRKGKSSNSKKCSKSRYSLKSPKSAKSKGSDIPPKVAPQSNRTLQIPSRTKATCPFFGSRATPSSRAGKKYHKKPNEPSNISDDHNSYQDFVPNSFADEDDDEDGNTEVTRPYQLELSMPKPRHSLRNMGRSHTVPPRIANAESHSGASAQNPLTGVNTIPLPICRSSVFTAATINSKETLVVTGPLPTSRSSISTAAAMTSNDPLVTTNNPPPISTSTLSTPALTTNSPPLLQNQLQPKKKRQRVAELEKQYRRRPKNDIPMDQRQSQEELIEIAKLPDKYARHVAAPHAFNFRDGKLYKEHFSIILSRPGVNGDGHVFTEEVLRRIL